MATVQIFKDTVSQAQNWMDTPRLLCAENILVAILIDNLFSNVWAMTIKNAEQAEQFWCREQLACSIIALETVFKCVQKPVCPDFRRIFPNVST